MKKIFIAIAFVIIAFGFFQLTGNYTVSSKILNTCELPQGHSKDKGVGPFKNVKLAPINEEKVKKGQILFNNQCALCHELDKVKVGPALRTELKDNSPEFILNMIVNTKEMEKRNSDIKGLVKEYKKLPMPDQNISQKDALSIFEYLRSVAK